MGPFDFSVNVPEFADKLKLELKPAVLLDEEVIYEGQWRDGR
jgi:hypothetical protein